MRSFASDNNSGVHPLVMDAVIKANDNHAVGYGDDPWTVAATAKIKEVFGEMASPFFVFNGTGANAVALQAVTRPFNSILCAETAHINVDECGAPARMTGCAIVTIPAPDGKLTPELIKPRLHNFGVCHHSQPKAVYISQVSELGTIYTIEEVKAIADLLHSYNMYLHMDGARLANACAYLNCSMREVTVDAGVDILLMPEDYAAAFEGVVQAVDRCGLPGAFTGGLTAAAGGIAASLIFAVAAALVGKSRDQN